MIIPAFDDNSSFRWQFRLSMTIPAFNDNSGFRWRVQLPMAIPAFDDESSFLWRVLLSMTSPASYGESWCLRRFTLPMSMSLEKRVLKRRWLLPLAKCIIQILLSSSVNYSDVANVENESCLERKISWKEGICFYVSWEPWKKSLG